jgi:hypothetical protein
MPDWKPPQGEPSLDPPNNIEPPGWRCPKCYRRWGASELEGEAYLRCPDCETELLREEDIGMW